MERESQSPAARLEILVLGAGRMGAQIGCEYAFGGHRVTFVTRAAAPAERRVQAALELAGRYGLASPGTLAGARPAIAVEEAVPDRRVDLIVESLPEDQDLKAKVISQAAAASPEATVATNTSSIGITELGALAGVGERIVATHYWNPPLLMPLVEVLAGRATAAERLERVIAVLRAIGKRPVRVRAEVPGMLWNRLQLALLREALWLVENGVADPEELDEVVRDGLARRWRLLGPFETVSLGGASTFDTIADNLFPVLSDARSSSGFGPFVIDDPERLSELAGRRDRGLADELRSDGQ